LGGTPLKGLPGWWGRKRKGKRKWPFGGRKETDQGKRMDRDVAKKTSSEKGDQKAVFNRQSYKNKGGGGKGNINIWEKRFGGEKKTGRKIIVVTRKERVRKSSFNLKKKRESMGPVAKK